MSDFQHLCRRSPSYRNLARASANAVFAATIWLHTEPRRFKKLQKVIEECHAAFRHAAQAGIIAARTTSSRKLSSEMRAPAFFATVWTTIVHALDEYFGD